MLVVLGNINVYNSYQNKKANDRLVEERIRHNRVLEGKGLYASSVRTKKKGRPSVRRRRRTKKKGTGLYMNKKPKALTGGNGLLKELMLKKKTLH